MVDNPLGGFASVTIAAGRSVAIDNDLLSEGDVSVTANDPAAKAANRQGGPGEIIQQVGVALAGANVTLTVDGTNAAGGGGVSIDAILRPGTVTIDSVGAITESVADDEPDVSGDIVILSTSDTGAEIGDPGTSSTDYLELLVTTRLGIATVDGAVAIHSPGPLVPGTDSDIDLPLGEVNVGDSTFIANVSHGGIIDANAGGGAPNITARGVNLVTQGGDDIFAGAIHVGNDGSRGGDIGSSAEPIRTDVGMLAATASNGGIFIDETDEVLIANIEARELNLLAQVGAGNQIVINSINLGVFDGQNDVVVTAGGDIVVNTVIASNEVSITSSGGNIFDNNQEATNITAQSVILDAADAVGQEPDAIESISEATAATAANGGAFLIQGISSVVDADATEDISASTQQGDLILGALSSTGGDVTAKASSGSILDGNGASVNITGDSAELVGSNGIGTVADSIETEIAALTVSVTKTGASFFIVGTDTEAIEISVNLLDVTTDSGGVWLEDLVGNLDIGLITAPGATVKIKAAGDINGHGPDAADSIDLTATGTGSIGIELDANTLNALTSDGGISINDTAGGVAVGLVSAAGNEVDLSASGGSITAVTPNDSTAEIIADDIILDSAGTIGADGSSLEIDSITLDAATSGGGIFITDLAGGIGLHTVDAGAGDVKLHVVDGSITAIADGGSADIIGTELHISVTDPSSHIGVLEAPIEIDGVVLRSVTTEGGSIFMADLAGGIAVDLVSTTDAAGSAIYLVAFDGSIVENPDADADLITESLFIGATGSGTLGTGDEALEIEVDNLSAITEGGSIWMTDLSGGVVIDSVTTGGADGSVIELTAIEGSILETEPGDAGPDLHAETVKLTVTGANQSIGTTTNGIEIIADSIVLDGGDRIFLNPQNPPGTPAPAVTFGPNPPGLAILNAQVAGGADIHLYKQAITVLDPYRDIQLFIGSNLSFPEAGELILSYEGLE